MYQYTVSSEWEPLVSTVGGIRIATFREPVIKEAPPQRDPNAGASNLQDLCTALGWQGGTIHQVIDEIKRLRATQAPLCKCCGDVATVHKCEDCEHEDSTLHL
jgi:hypothetical protein